MPRSIRHKQNGCTQRIQKKEYQSYRDKIKLAFYLLDIEQLQLDYLDTGLANDRSFKNTVVFPMDQAIEVHFENNWKNMTGDSRFDNNFDTPGPNTPPTIGKFKSFKRRSRFFYQTRYYKIYQEEEGSRHEMRWPTINREIDHDFCAVFDEEKPGKQSTNTANVEETGKLLKMLNQAAFMVKASNVVMKDLENNLQNEEIYIRLIELTRIVKIDKMKKLKAA